MHRRLKDPLGCACLHDLAGIKNRNLVRDAPHHPEIVTNEQHGEAASRLQVCQ